MALFALPTVRFPASSTASQRHAVAYISRRVHLALCPWFPDTLSFRHRLKEHRAIVSGSFVLAVVAAPASWVPGDLDLYVATRSGFNALRHYLEDEQGFEDITPPPFLANPGYQAPYPVADPEDNPPIPPQAAMDDYRRFSKTVQVNNQHMQVFVDLILIRSSSPANIVLQFPASCAMNWLTANEIIVTYPNLTVNNIALLRPHGRGAPTGHSEIREGLWLDKYIGTAPWIPSAVTLNALAKSPLGRAFVL
ncbi:hypothetical protein FRC00_002955 [Tulasnella sp. 408]|nr:hypothetical protein FRC00_002955 [Tulasnella sp. 408]